MTKTFKISLLYSQILFFILLPGWIELTKYLHSLVIVIVWFCFSSFVLFVVNLVKKEKIRVSINLLHFVALFYSLGLLVLLFFRPQNQSYGTINLIPFETIYFYLSGQVDYLIAIYNLGANIGLFLPFGLYYRYISKHPTIKKLIVITICSISLIETLQFLTKRGSLDIDDLILNVLGVCLGYLIHPIFQRVLVIKKVTN